jgi:AcrR family transcriptional regulator
MRVTLYTEPMPTPDAPTESPAEPPLRRRDLAVARSLDSARVRSEGRVQRFLDAGFELLSSAESGKEFTVQEVVDRSGQSLRSFYQYFAGKHELLLALFDEAIRSTCDRLEEQIERAGTPLDRLRVFVVGYYKMCLPEPNGRASKNNPTPVMAEFCHQLLTAHQLEAARAFVPLVTLLEKVVADAVEAGVVRPEFQTDNAAGTVLSTIMFNAAYASTITGTDPPDADGAADAIWAYISGGILTASAR